MAQTIDDPAAAFIDHFRLRPARRDERALAEVGAAFAQLPYENLTKLLKKHAPAAAGDRRRMPAEVLQDHLELGSGGTCFALTRLFELVLERLGFRCHAALCDMRHATDSHCALVVELGHRRVLLDPAYQLHRPLPLPDEAPFSERELAVGRAQLVARGDGSCDLATGGRWRYRLKLAPVDHPRLDALWLASFGWTMMDNIHICRAEEHGYAYVHGNKLRLQRRGDKQTLNLRGQQEQQLAERFGLAEPLIRRAYQLAAVLRQRPATPR